MLEEGTDDLSLDVLEEAQGFLNIFKGAVDTGMLSMPPSWNQTKKDLEALVPKLQELDMMRVLEPKFATMHGDDFFTKKKCDTHMGIFSTAVAAAPPEELHKMQTHGIRVLEQYVSSINAKAALIKPANRLGRITFHKNTIPHIKMLLNLDYCFSWHSDGKKRAFN